MKQASSNPFVFIVGCPRSGTTLLKRIINAHRQIAVVDAEQHWIVRYLRNGSLKKGAGKHTGVAAEGTVTPAFLSSLWDYETFAKLRLNRLRVANILEPGKQVSYSEFISAVFDLYGETKHKSLVGDKTPGNVHDIPVLHRLWPRARFVHVIRDGRDVCLSALSWRERAARFTKRFRSWGGDPVTTAAMWWKWQAGLGCQDGRALGPALYYEMRYESLVHHPEEECVRVCQFLGVPFDPSMLEFHKGKTRAGRDAKESWLGITPGLRDWQTQMPPHDVELFEAAAGDLLKELGYRVPSGTATATPEHTVAIRNEFAEDVLSKGGRLPTRWGGVSEHDEFSSCADRLEPYR